MLGADASADAVLAALDAGASAYITMTQPVEDIVEAVRRAGGRARSH